MDKRLIELETRLAYQEDMIQDLNKIIFEQQKRLDQLEMAYQYLLEQNKEQAEATPTSIASDEKPPHY